MLILLTFKLVVLCSKVFSLVEIKLYRYFNCLTMCKTYSSIYANPFYFLATFSILAYNMYNVFPFVQKTFASKVIVKLHCST